MKDNFRIDNVVYVCYEGNVLVLNENEIYGFDYLLFPIVLRIVGLHAEKDCDKITYKDVAYFDVSHITF